MAPHKKRVRWADQHGQPPTVYIVPRKTPQQTLEPALLRREQRTQTLRALQAMREYQAEEALMHVAFPDMLGAWHPLLAPR